MDINTIEYQDDSGYTLIEILIAMSLFALVITVFMTLFVNILFDDRMSEQKKALEICQQELLIPSPLDASENSLFTIDQFEGEKKMNKDGRLVTLIVYVKHKTKKNVTVTLSRSFLSGP